MKRKQSSYWKKAGAAGCAVILVVSLAGCTGQEGAPAQSIQSAPLSESQVQSETENAKSAAPLGTEMTSEEIVRLATELVEAGQRWESWASDPAAQQLDCSDSITVERLGEPVTLYRLPDMESRAQVENALLEIFSRNYVDRKMETIFGPDAPYSLQEQNGALYANGDFGFDNQNVFRYTGNFVVIGCTEDSISLQAELRDNDGELTENWPLTLRREEGRWVLDGWKTDEKGDNSFVALPEELEQQTQQDPELASQLRYAWMLGDGLVWGSQRWVDWCFSGLFEPPVEVPGEEYPLADLSDLKVEEFEVEIGPEEKVYLMLDVTQPGNTPLRQGRNWYLLDFSDNGTGKVNGTIRRMYPDGENAVFGLGRDQSFGKEEENARLNEELMAVVNTFRGWASASPCDRDWWQEGGEVPYVVARMHQDGLIGTDGLFTEEQFNQAARDYLNAPDYQADKEHLLRCCYEQDGRFSLMEMGGLTADIGDNCRNLGGDLAAGTATVIRRYYKDTLGLVPDYDLVYTMERSLDGTGHWYVYQCQKVPGGVSYIG